jgi:dihydroorotase-like cyclic amidohydrolase
MNLITLPGLIDLHVHFRDPGQTDKEDFYSGTSAALAGGFTTVFDMPNNLVPITTAQRLQEKINLASKKIVCDIGFYFGSLGDNLDQFELVKDTVLGLKLYLNETTGNFLITPDKLEQIFTAWKPLNKPILLHAEDDAIEAVIEIVKKTGQRAHFCHISLKSDLEQIMQAKHNNLPITCGVTPHHLFLTEKDGEKLGPFGRMKPYLKSQADVNFLWKHLDAIDVIESDHAPHTIEEKASDTPPFGVPGLDTTLPLLLTAVNRKQITINDIIRLCHDGPLKVLGLDIDTGTIEIDLDEQYSIERKNLFTKCGWSPFEGRKVQGKVKKIINHGKTVFENGELLAKPGEGEILYQ